ncbi:hypothetical protein CDD83_6537 [Cordyceps sp. RAO-2017]|nr:hypothetical protein CDD83_6537 [Cordyceps sp. RAO-2017]
MRRLARLLGAAAGLSAVAAGSWGDDDLEVPSLDVRRCPTMGAANFSIEMPELTRSFPRTWVLLCYTSDNLHLEFDALDEKYFYDDPWQGTNGDIIAYEVLVALIAKGADDPLTYFEFEVNPSNVTYQAYVHNPSKTRAENQPFGRFIVEEPEQTGIRAFTSLNRWDKRWAVSVRLPLSLFNVGRGEGWGTHWRMNFFRTVVGPESWPKQRLGGWSPPNLAEFHMTQFFGRVKFL